MKIFAITDNYRHFSDGERHRGPGWVFLPDSSIFRAPNPFFLDDENDSVAAYPSLAVRIDRLGKSIASKFASRYSAHAALGVNIRNLTLEETLKTSGLPVDPSWGYDRSLLLSDWIGMSTGEMEDSSVVLKISGDGDTRDNVNGLMEWNCRSLILSVSEIISEVSRTNILKMGDLILCGLPEKGLRLTPGSRLGCSLISGGISRDEISIAIK